MPKPKGSKNGNMLRKEQKKKELIVPQGWENARPTTSSTTPIRRSTERISISLLAEERAALEERAARLRSAGHRDIKTSRLARVAFNMLQEVSDEAILSAAAMVENLEMRRAQKRG